MAAIEVAMEDDVFFADLNRQISLLIDDDDELPLPDQFPSLSPQGFSESIIIQPPIILTSQYLYQENYWRREMNMNMNMNMMSKGTGVFIPQSSQPKRKHKQGKRAPSNYTTKSNNKQLIHSRGRSNVNFSPVYATNINRY